jgi:hypothetical protein
MEYKVHSFVFYLKFSHAKVAQSSLHYWHTEHIRRCWNFTVAYFRFVFPSDELHYSFHFAVCCKGFSLQNLLNVFGYTTMLCAVPCAVRCHISIRSYCWWFFQNYIARFGHGSAKLARQAQSKEKTLAKMVAQGLTEKVTSDKTVHFYFPSCGSIPPPVIMVQVWDMIIHVA